MDDALYIALSGAKTALRNQTINANNLANVRTTGFRADLQNTESRALVGEGLSARIFTTNGKSIADFSAGAIITTGRDLDVAVQGEGWIAVQSSSGEEAYTRLGSLKILLLPLRPSL